MTPRDEPAEVAGAVGDGADGTDASGGAEVSDRADGGAQGAQERPEPVDLDTPPGGVPDVVTDERALATAARAIAAGTGPVAVDAERASGYRYGQRAYLVQLRRAGAGTVLIDPISCPDLRPIGEAIGTAQWVLHAATQDLPCLAEVGMTPAELFDTELGARLVGLFRVGLAAVVEHYLGLRLAKEHSAVDWSTRPLPEPWLRYAALDVEVLVDLRDAIAADLQEQGKSEWARQEFAALIGFTPPPRTDPWRRTSGMHRIRSRRGLAVLRELWQEREAIAQDRDISPGRILSDAILVDIALSLPRSADQLEALARNRALKRYQRQWLGAVRRGRGLAERELPLPSVHSDAPPPPRAWADRDPAAAARLVRARTFLAEIGQEHRVPVENLISPEAMRRVLWSPPSPATATQVGRRLGELGARPWQVELVGEALAKAIEAP